MNKTAIVWVVAAVVFILYYVFFNRIETSNSLGLSPMLLHAVDFVSAAITMLIFAVIVSLVPAIFLWRDRPYSNRVFMLLPYSFIGVVMLLALMMTSLD